MLVYMLLTRTYNLWETHIANNLHDHPTCSRKPFISRTHSHTKPRTYAYMSNIPSCLHCSGKPCSDPSSSSAARLAPGPRWTTLSRWLGTATSSSWLTQRAHRRKIFFSAVVVLQRAHTHTPFTRRGAVDSSARARLRRGMILILAYGVSAVA